MASEQGTPVDLYIYDLTHGLAALLSPAIIGRQVAGVWHTALVVYEREYFFSAGGITSCAPGGTQLGAPQSVQRLGYTHVPYALFVEYLDALAATTYTGASYRLLEHNCNHFTEEAAGFLCGGHVPKHILEQPAQLPPPLRLALSALLDAALPAQRLAARALAKGAAPPPARPPALLLHRAAARGPSPAAGPRYHRRPRLRPRPRRRPDPPPRPPPAAPAAQPPAAALPRSRPPPLPTAAGAGGVRRARGESPDFLSLNQEVEAARAEGAALEQRRSTLAEKLARKQRRRERRRHRHAAAGDPALHDDEMAEAVAEVRAGPSAAGGGEEAGGEAPGAGESGAAGVAEEVDERKERELRRRERDPPIVYRDIDGAAEWERLAAGVAGAELAGEERQALDELQQYLALGEGSWVLGDHCLAFLGRILSEPGLAGAREAALRCLAAAALRDDVSLLLHQDRRHHALLTYAFHIDRHPPAEQLALALFMCNLFEHASSAEWLLYISEWEAAGGGGGAPLSNIRATTKVCVHCALAEGELREYGTALMYNVATRDVKTVVFDEVCVELAMAVLQLLAWAPAEEAAWRCLRALARLAARPDVPQLVHLVGPHPSAFRGQSPRIDEEIEALTRLLK